MATIIGLPKLSPTMEEGVLAKWHKKEGDQISPGDIVAEVETDKANMDFPIEDEGTLLKLLVKEGETVKLGAPVAILGEKGEDVSELVAQAAQPAAATGSPAEGSKLKAESEPEKKPSGNGAGQPASPVATILASPIAKTLAAEHGIDLRKIRGSGPGGRIVERDVRAVLETPAPPPPPAAPSPAPAPARAPAPTPKLSALSFQPSAEPREHAAEEFTDKSLSLMRKTIAKRLTESKSTVPHFYLTVECDAEPLMAFRAAMNKVLGDDGKVSVNDLIVKAAALALRKVPAANASFLGDRIRYHGRVHVGVAVAVEDGLITPVVRDTDGKGIRAISAEVRDLASRARARKLMPEEMTGGTFTVSNLGMFGVSHFEAIINPPEGAVLAVGAVRKLAVVVQDENGEDALTIGQHMSLTLSCDHRVIDGALGATLLKALVEILENPAALAL